MEEVELLRRQAEPLPVPLDLARARVDGEPVELDALGGAGGRSRASEHRLDARRELTRRERLRHVVVGAELEADDAIGLLSARGEHDHGQVAAGADPSAQREPVGAGKHHVEDDELRRGPLDELAGAVPVRGDERVEPVSLQVANDHVPHDRLVVDHEDGCHHRIVAHGPGAQGDFRNRSQLE